MAKKSDELQKYYKTNQSLWNQRTPIHLKSEMYALENFMQGNTSLKPVELQALPDVATKTMLHLQCHFGQDSLSWARLGAKVTGVDLSDVAIKKARELNQKLGLDARFIQANIYDLPAILEQQFDIVFTSYGVLCWLHDLHRWAEIVQQQLKPGGVFFIVETHPILYMYEEKTRELKYSYFYQEEPLEEYVQGTYTDFDAAIQHKEYSWNHALSEIISPLLRQGLILETFEEYSWFPYNCFPDMTEVEPGKFVYGSTKVRLPHMFALKMKKAG